MTTYFVSRHPGARQWLAEEGLSADQYVSHLDPADILPGDLVIGCLGIHQVAELQARGARYQHLAMDLEADARGVELDAAGMRARGARLEEYRVRAVTPVTPVPEDVPRLFIAVATGQQIANFPPILELSRPGDAVMWLETPDAQARGWSRRGDGILSREGLQLVPGVAVADLNDPAAVTDKVREAVARYPDHRLYVVGNGGQKLSPVGILNGCRDRDPVLIYGDGEPIALRMFHRGLSQPPARCLYTRNTLDLEDVLMVSGYQAHSIGRRIWPADGPPPMRDPRYGEDVAFTGEIHAGYHAWCRDNGKTGKAPGELGNLGWLFEEAVARRLYHWLRQQPAMARVVRSVHTNVAVGRVGEAQRRAEWDIVLTLRNGILLCIECKSFSAVTKDLDARLLNLQQAGSRLATMVVRAPVYAPFLDRPWYRNTKQFITRVWDLDTTFHFLPFTLPGQPQSLRWRRRQPPRPCPSFEQVLERLLERYIPAVDPADGIMDGA